MLRLRNRAQFQAVLAARVIAKSEHFALHRHPLDGDGPVAPSASSAPSQARPLFAPAGLWLGAMVPKRWAKRSVTRHAIKRQIYDVAGLMLPPADQAAYVLRLRAGFSREHFHSSTSEVLKQAVRAELEQLMARLQRPA